MKIIEWWRAGLGEVMRMAAEPRSGPFDAGTLAGRAWLAALPDELAAQRRVMAGLVDRCEAWPLVTSLLVGCSLGRGAAGVGRACRCATAPDRVRRPVGPADLRPVRRRHPARPGGRRRGADRSAP